MDELPIRGRWIHSLHLIKIVETIIKFDIKCLIRDKKWKKVLFAKGLHHVKALQLMYKREEGKKKFINLKLNKISMDIRWTIVELVPIDTFTLTTF